MKKLVLVLLLAVALMSCQNPSTSEIPSGAGKQETYKIDSCIYSSAELFTVQTNHTSENYRDYSLGILDWSNAASYKVEFDYLLIKNTGFGGNDIEIFQGVNVAVLIGNFNETNYQFTHAVINYPMNPEINSYENTTLRVIIQYSYIVYAVKNLKIYKL